MTRPVRPATARQGQAYKNLRISGIVCLISMALGTSVGATTSDAPAFPVQVVARFDPIRHETHIRGDMAANSCITFRLSDEWRLSSGDGASYSLTAPSGAEIAVRLRSAADLRGLPQPDQTDRNAAALQQEYEEIIGKPVQAVSHEPTSHAGVSRWSATWIDANVANPSHSLTIEALILAVTGGSTLELTFTGNWRPETHRVEISRLLSSLRIVKGGECHHHSMAGW